jgi:hypothetical protein
MIFLFFMETSRDSDFWHCGSNADVPVYLPKRFFPDSDKMQLRTDVAKWVSEIVKTVKRGVVGKRLKSSLVG